MRASTLRLAVSLSAILALLAFPIPQARAGNAKVCRTQEQRYEQIDSRGTAVVECRFYGGMSVEETAEALGTSPATVKPCTQSRGTNTKPPAVAVQRSSPQWPVSSPSST